MAVIPLECVVSAGMVALFTIMLKKFYESDGECDFSVLPFIVMLLGDFGVLFLRWNEEINFFVLIFAGISTALWIAGRLVKAKSTR